MVTPCSIALADCVLYPAENAYRPGFCLKIDAAARVLDRRPVLRQKKRWGRNMKKFLIIPAACLILAGGCASTAQMRRLEENSRTNQKTLHETDQRLQKLEQSVAALDSQVAVLNNRVYEVRTRSGRNTGMTVVPILPAQTAKPEVNSPQPSAGRFQMTCPLRKMCRPRPCRWITSPETDATRNPFRYPLHMEGHPPNQRG